MSTNKIWLAVCFIAFNNFVWFCVYQGNISSPAPVVSGNNDMADVANNIPIATPPTCEEKFNQSLLSGTTLDSFELESDADVALSAEQPLPPQELVDLNLPPEMSERALLERSSERELFYFASAEQKLATLRTLQPMGEDLILIEEIIHSAEDEEIKVAALQALAGANNYASTQLLMQALDDGNETIAANALYLLAQSGDRTLLPVLEDRLTSLAEGGLRDEYRRAISSLTTSVTMGMDNL